MSPVPAKLDIAGGTKVSLRSSLGTITCNGVTGTAEPENGTTGKSPTVATGRLLISSFPLRTCRPRRARERARALRLPRSRPRRKATAVRGTAVAFATCLYRGLLPVYDADYLQLSVVFMLIPLASVAVSVACASIDAGLPPTDRDQGPVVFSAVEPSVNRCCWVVLPAGDARKDIVAVLLVPPQAGEVIVPSTPLPSTVT